MVVIRFIGEFFKWALTGFKIRSAEEIEARYNICKPCLFYQPFAPDVDYGTCEKCGCNIHRTDRKLNKLAWESTHCPDSRWSRDSLVHP